MVRSERRERYHITLIHAQDDMNIPASHSDNLAWHAVDASIDMSTAKKESANEKDAKKVDLGDGGWSVEWTPRAGTIREERPRYGGHNKIKVYPIVGFAVSRAFHAADLSIEHQQILQANDMRSSRNIGQ